MSMVVGNVHALAIEERSFQLPQLESLSSLSNNGVIHYPFTCLDAAARKKMHTMPLGCHGQTAQPGCTHTVCRKVCYPLSTRRIRGLSHWSPDDNRHAENI